MLGPVTSTDLSLKLSVIVKFIVANYFLECYSICSVSENLGIIPNGIADTPPITIISSFATSESTSDRIELGINMGCKVSSRLILIPANKSGSFWQSFNATLSFAVLDPGTINNPPFYGHLRPHHNNNWSTTAYKTKVPYLRSIPRPLDPIGTQRRNLCNSESPFNEE